MIPRLEFLRLLIPPAALLAVAAGPSGCGSAALPGSPVASRPPVAQPLAMNASPTARPNHPAVAAATTRFGIDLLQHLVRETPRGNVFLSPYGIAAALAMTWVGAEGETKAAMAKTLGLAGMSREAVEQQAGELRQSLAAPGPQVELDVANSLWAQQGVALQPAFLSENERFFGAAVRSLDFGVPGAEAEVNQWVREQTHGRIPALLRAEDCRRDLMLVLLNAVYFKGAWSERFDSSRTREAAFTLADGSTRRVPMMHRTGETLHFRGDNFQAVSLPYGPGRFRMLVFLPDPGTTVEGLSAALAAAAWEQWMRRFEQGRGELALPRFRLEYEASLKRALSALGMEICFSPRADFRRLVSERAAISEVRHKTFLDVNEEGTEAAAATSVHVEKTAIAPSFRMVVDRPFLAAIRDDETGALLFLGAVNDPLNQGPS